MSGIKEALRGLKKRFLNYKYFAVYGGSPKLFRHSKGHPLVDKVLMKFYEPKSNRERDKYCMVAMGLHRALIFLPIVMLDFTFLPLFQVSLLAGVPYYLVRYLPEKIKDHHHFDYIRVPELINAVLLATAVYA